MTRNNNNSPTTTATLKTTESYTRDVGRGVARIDYHTMDLLGVGTGNVIEVKGKNRTVAKCLPVYSSDEGKGIIRLDGLMRNNARIAIGDTVIIKKLKAIPAQKVMLAPLQPTSHVHERYLADAHESVPVINGDNVIVPYFGGRLAFQIAGITPVITSENAAIATQKTIFDIAEVIPEALYRGPQVTYEDIGGLNEEIQKV